MGFEERFRKRLARWTRQYICKDERIILSSFPLYLMSILHLLRKVKLRLEHIQRNFLFIFLCFFGVRGGGSLEYKMHLVKWSSVRLDKSLGGLGL